MQKPNNEFVETILMAIPADMLEEVGIGPCSTVQMHVSRGRIIIQAVDEEACGGSREFFVGGGPVTAAVRVVGDENVQDHRKGRQDHHSMGNPAEGWLPAG